MLVVILKIKYGGYVVLYTNLSIMASQSSSSPLGGQAQGQEHRPDRLPDPDRPGAPQTPAAPHSRPPPHRPPRQAAPAQPPTRQRPLFHRTRTAATPHPAPARPPRAAAGAPGPGNGRPPRPALLHLRTGGLLERGQGGRPPPGPYQPGEGGPGAGEGGEVPAAVEHLPAGAGVRGGGRRAGGDCLHPAPVLLQAGGPRLP